jgi:Fe-S oxidoreductase
LQAAVPHGLIPAELGCCGMAGDRGWSRPGLTAAATARERAACSGPGITTSPTCGAALGYDHLWTYLRRRLESAHG